MSSTKTELETERLVLRHFELGDVDALFRNLASDPEVVRFMSYSLCETVDATGKMIDEWFEYFDKVAPESWELFVVVLKSSGEVIGTIDFAEVDREARSAEVGYQFGKAWWGFGYATEALQALIVHCFETVGLNRIWADHDPHNIGSGKVMQKAGMLYEGTFRQCKVRHGELVSRVYNAILAEDYFGRCALHCN